MCCPDGTRPKIANCVMYTLLKIFVVLVLARAFVGWLADRRAAARRPDVTPGLSFLPGDFKYESPNGNVRTSASRGIPAAVAVSALA